VIGTLKAAFVQGMLAKDEFDQRVGQAFAARTHADLAALTADIPAGLTVGQPPREAARAQDRPTMSTAAKENIVVAVAILVPAILTFATGSPLFSCCSRPSTSRPWWLPVPRYSSRRTRSAPAGSYHPDQTQADLRMHRSRSRRS